jgi:hypothetical protein
MVSRKRLDTRQTPSCLLVSSGHRWPTERLSQHTVLDSHARQIGTSHKNAPSLQITPKRPFNRNVVQLLYYLHRRESSYASGLISPYATFHASS